MNYDQDELKLLEIIQKSGVKEQKTIDFLMTHLMPFIDILTNQKARPKPLDARLVTWYTKWTGANDNPEYLAGVNHFLKGLFVELEIDPRITLNLLKEAE